MQVLMVGIMLGKKLKIISLLSKKPPACAFIIGDKSNEEKND